MPASLFVTQGKLGIERMLAGMARSYSFNC